MIRISATLVICMRVALLTHISGIVSTHMSDCEGGLGGGQRLWSQHDCICNLLPIIGLQWEPVVIHATPHPGISDGWRTQRRLSSSFVIEGLQGDGGPLAAQLSLRDSSCASTAPRRWGPRCAPRTQSSHCYRAQQSQLCVTRS